MMNNLMRVRLISLDILEPSLGVYCSNHVGGGGQLNAQQPIFLYFLIEYNGKYLNLRD